MTTSLANISIKDSSSWNTYLNLIYPIGSLFISINATSPASLFGGSWVQLTGAFLRMDNNTYTGGSNNLSVPWHTHGFPNVNGRVGRAGLYASDTDYSRTRVLLGTSGQYSLITPTQANIGTSTQVNATGVDGTNANMPFYQNCYAWYRTA